MPENRLIAGEKEEPTLAEKRTRSPLLWTTDHMPTNTRSTPPKAATIFVPVSTAPIFAPSRPCRREGRCQTAAVVGNVEQARYWADRAESWINAEDYLRRISDVFTDAAFEALA